MSAKWASGADDKSGGGETSPLRGGGSSILAEDKDRSATTTTRRPRRPRPGESEAGVDAKGNEIERPSIKTIEGGWGLSGTSGSVSNEAQSKATARNERMKGIAGNDGGVARPVRRNHFDNDETEILVIPDLEDDAEEDIETKVAVAPKNTTRRVPTLHELDEDLKYSVPSAADGLDMSLLTKTLVPPEMLEEDDTVWDFDGLLQAVTQEFNAQARADRCGTYDGESSKGLPQPSQRQSNTVSRASRALVV